MQKAIIRNNFPPQIAERMCDAIDGKEKAEHFQRLLQEYNEWLVNQQRQQAMVERLALPSSVTTRQSSCKHGSVLAVPSAFEGILWVRDKV